MAIYPRFICLEGLDGVGKTEIGKAISNKLSYSFYQSPGGNFSQARQIVDDGSLTPLVRYFFFRAASQHDSENIARLLRTTGVVCDRYIYSTFAYHAAMDSRIRSMFNMTDLLIPDRTVLLIARDDIRTIRIAARSHKSKIRIPAEIEHGIDRLYRKFGHETFDTSETTVEQAAALILEKISNIS